MDVMAGKIASKIIYYGHQSVGADIINAISALNRGRELGLDIQDTPQVHANSGRGRFLHSKIGQNFDPASKDAGFSQNVEQLAKSGLDMAFYKYCYVDVDADTDIDTVLHGYLATLRRLKKQHPNVIFIAWTLPLTIVQRGPRAFIKNIIQRPIGGYADNAKRNIYNQMLLTECENEFPVFDLAKYEANYGKTSQQACTYRYRGKIFHALCDEHARDGRHLNPSGASHIASHLLAFLEALAN